MLLLATGCNQNRYQPAEWQSRNVPSNSRSEEGNENQENEQLLLSRFGELTPWLDPRLSTGQRETGPAPTDWTGATLPGAPFRGSTLPDSLPDTLPLRSGSTLPLREGLGRDTRNSTLPLRLDGNVPVRGNSTLPMKREDFQFRPDSNRTLPLPPVPANRFQNDRRGSTLPTANRPGR